MCQCTSHQNIPAIRFQRLTALQKGIIPDNSHIQVIFPVASRKIPNYAFFGFPQVRTIIIPTAAMTTALARVSSTTGTSDLYIVVIE